MNPGSAIALASAAAWAGANVAIQAASRRVGSVGALLFGQIIGGVSVGIVALVVEGVPRDWSVSVVVALLAGGVASAVAYAGLFESLRRGAVSVVTPVISSWALVSLIIASVMHAALPPALACGGAGMIIGGNVLVARSSRGEPGEERKRSTVALAWACLAAIGFGAMVPAIDIVGAHLGRLMAIPLTWGVELLIGLPIVLRFGLVPTRPRGSDWWVVSGAAILEVAGFVGVSVALSLAPVAIVSPLASLSTALTVLVGIAWLRERPPALAIAGALLASAGVVLVQG